jgi:hypothetical protein
MSKTKSLRAVVTSKLKTIAGGVYHRFAPADAEYPYKTYTLSSGAFPNSLRDDLDLEIDIWDRSPDPKTVEDIADQIEMLFNDANLPEPPIYPTFFRENRYLLDDPDKTLQHIQLRFLVQLYEEE